ncbi:MAG: translation initiation factor IF-3, partial [Duncaniella sp.]|nr:translation initiation factor IF-3 [Duncaniella sp.]
MEKKPFTPRPPRPANAANGPRRPFVPNKEKDPYATNEHIRAREVRLVGDNVETGIYSIQEALKMAEEQELDLVEISPTAQP